MDSWKKERNHSEWPATTIVDSGRSAAHRAKSCSRWRPRKRRPLLPLFAEPSKTIAPERSSSIRSMRGAHAAGASAIVSKLREISCAGEGEGEDAGEGEGEGEGEGAGEGEGEGV